MHAVLNDSHSIFLEKKKLFLVIQTVQCYLILWQNLYKTMCWFLFQWFFQSVDWSAFRRCFEMFKGIKSKHLTFDAKVKFWMYHTFDFVVIVRPVYFVHLARCWIDVAMLFELPNWGNNKKAIQKSPGKKKKKQKKKNQEKEYISSMLKWSKDSDKNFIKFA